MDKNKVFVGGLPWSLDNDSLRDLFAQCGEIMECVVIKDRDTGQSKGFGFITFSDENGVKNALALDATQVDGKQLAVKPAKPREARPSFGGGQSSGRDFRRDNDFKKRRDRNY